ncbi:TNF receptor-associated factor 5-like [Dysidea avara]|uniref:TNF receptor-associated factor 5-like n=1 Tax=Dysidea avara TaxID=196820 RepID=UPI0033280B0F
MKAHREECPLEIVRCEYLNVGCEERMMRKDLKKHEEEKMKDHLFMTKHEMQQQITDLKHQLSDAKQQLSETESELSGTNQQLSANLEQKYSDNEAELFATQQQLSISTSELDSTKLQLAIALKQINSLMVLMYHTTLSTNISGTESIVSAAKWSVTLAVISEMSTSGGQMCPVIVKLTEFQEKEEEQIEWYSNPFYTHDRGYKMCLCVCPAGNGAGIGTHLSVYLCIMNGPYDDELTWPLVRRFEVLLLNQKNDCIHTLMDLSLNMEIDDDHVDGGCNKGIDGEAFDSSTDDKDFDDNDEMNDGNDDDNDEEKDNDEDKEEDDDDDNEISTAHGRDRFISKEILNRITSTRQYLKDDCVFFRISML